MEVLISIIVTCYNQEEFIEATLDSLKMQTYQNWECIIIDDGSIDKSALKIQNFIREDLRFSFYSQENKGVSVARNFGLNRAKGLFIQFLDGDDRLENSKLEESMFIFNGDENLDIVFSDFKMYNFHNNKEITAFCKLDESVLNFEKVLFQWDEHFAIPIHCGFFKKDFLKGIRFNEKLRSKEDWVMWVEVFIRRPKIQYISRRLAIYTIHKNSITKSSNMFKDHLLALECLKVRLDHSMYIQLLERFVKRYYCKSINFKAELISLQKSPVYRIYRLFKKFKFKG